MTVAVRADLYRDCGDFTPGRKGGGNEEAAVVIASILEAIEQLLSPNWLRDGMLMSSRESQMFSLNPSCVAVLCFFYYYGNRLIFAES